MPPIMIDHIRYILIKQNPENIKKKVNYRARLFGQKPLDARQKSFKKKNDHKLFFKLIKHREDPFLDCQIDK